MEKWSLMVECGASTHPSASEEGSGKPQSPTISGVNSSASFRDIFFVFMDSWFWGVRCLCFFQIIMKTPWCLWVAKLVVLNFRWSNLEFRALSAAQTCAFIGAFDWGEGD